MLRLPASPRPRAGRRSAQSQDDFLDRVAWFLSLADDDEAALGKHPQAGDVVLDNTRVEWPLGELGDQLGQGPRCVPLPPVLAADPVADVSFAFDVEAADVADDLAIGADDRAGDARAVGEDPGPV